jgi:uncharacterized protein
MTTIKRKYLLLLVGLCLSIAASAQRLHRKGTLGIDYEQASAELMTSLRVAETHGIVVKNVLPNSTAEKLGLQKNDVLIAINETDSLFLFDFLQAINRLYENDPISVTLVRNRYKSRVVGTVAPAAKESSPTGEVIYDEVAYQRGSLRAIIHKPLGAGRFPAVFYMQDYACNSIDFSTNPNNPVKQLVDGWVKAGFVVFRVEKPGVGESEGTRDCARLSYAEELRVFERGFASLKKQANVDSNRVFLFGYSTGGITAPLMAAKGPKPKGIITYGTVIKPWFEYMIDVTRKQPMLFKESLQSIEVNARMLTPLLFDWLVMGKSANELLENPDYEAILTAKENPLNYNKGTLLGRSPLFFHELNQQNLFQAWAQAAVPTLAIHGEMDVQAIDAEAAQTIVKIVNEGRAGRGTFKTIKGTDHYFAKVPSFEEHKKLLDSRKYFGDYDNRNFNPEIVEMTVEWMKKQ